MTKIIVTAVALGLIVAIAALSQAPAGPKHHAVFQMSDAQESGEWDPLIAHVTNIGTAFANDGGVEVEVIFYGPGLNMLRKSNTAFEERLKTLADAGVTLSACQNAMRFMNIQTEDMFPFVNQVDSGVAQLTRRQEQGWAYIK